MERKNLISYFVIVIFVLTSLMVGISGCKKEERVRKYTEKKPITEKFHSDVPVRKKPLFVWDVPRGWKEEKSTSQFRLATFSVIKEKKKSLCTIIPLQGKAGGLKANTSRWLTQILPRAIDTPVKTDFMLNKQQNFKTKGNFAAVFLDFTLLTEKPAAMSLLVTVIQVRENSVFIKMAGPKSHLIENREKFKTLSLSFRLRKN